MPTAPPTITPYATPPSSADADTFDARADAKVADDVTKVGEYTALAANVYNNALEAQASAVASAASAAASHASELASQASANAAAGAAGATAWNPSTNYALDQRAWSLINGQLYRRIVPGISATDPKLDQTNWARVWVEPEMVTSESLFMASF